MGQIRGGQRWVRIDLGRGFGESHRHRWRAWDLRHLEGREACAARAHEARNDLGSVEQLQHILELLIKGCHGGLGRVHDCWEILLKGSCRQGLWGWLGSGQVLRGNSKQFICWRLVCLWVGKWTPFLDNTILLLVVVYRSCVKACQTWLKAPGSPKLRQHPVTKLTILIILCIKYVCGARILCNPILPWSLDRSDNRFGDPPKSSKWQLCWLHHMIHTSLTLITLLPLLRGVWPWTSEGPGLGCSCWNVSKKGSNGLDMAIGGMNSRITSIQIIQHLDFEHSTCSNGSSNCNYVLRRTFMYGIMDIGNLI